MTQFDALEKQMPLIVYRAFMVWMVAVLALLIRAVITSYAPGGLYDLQILPRDLANCIAPATLAGYYCGSSQQLWRNCGRAVRLWLMVYAVATIFDFNISVAGSDVFRAGFIYSVVCVAVYVFSAFRTVWKGEFAI